MADNYLEKHREDYEKRKQEWLRKKKYLTKKQHVVPPAKPEDEAL